MKVRRILVAILTCASLTGIAEVASGSAEWAACQGAGSVELTPGLTNEPRDIEVVGSATFEHCASSDPTISSSTLTITGNIKGGTCLENAPAFGTAIMTWSNGNTSEMAFVTKGVGAVGQVTGVVTGGTEFVGTVFDALAVFTGDLSKCDTDEGLTTAGFEEVNSFG